MKKSLMLVSLVIVIIPVILSLGFMGTGNVKFKEALLVYLFYWLSYIFFPFSLGFSLIVTAIIPLLFLETMFEIGIFVGIISSPLAIGMIVLPFVVMHYSLKDF